MRLFCGWGSGFITGAPGPIKNQNRKVRGHLLCCLATSAANCVANSLMRRSSGICVRWTWLHSEMKWPNKSTTSGFVPSWQPPAGMVLPIWRARSLSFCLCTCRHVCKMPCLAVAGWWRPVARFGQTGSRHGYREEGSGRLSESPHCVGVRIVRWKCGSLASMRILLPSSLGAFFPRACGCKVFWSAQQRRFVFRTRQLAKRTSVTYRDHGSPARYLLVSCLDARYPSCVKIQGPEALTRKKKR